MHGVFIESRQSDLQRADRWAWHRDNGASMEVLYMLLPLSLLFVMVIGGVLWWAIFSGQYDDPDQAGRSILEDDDTPKRD